MRTNRVFILVSVCLIVSSCASHYSDATHSDPYGFFSGLLHGFLFPFVLVGFVISWMLSLLDISLWADITFVGKPNTGFTFYYVGYFIGVMTWLSGAK